MTNTLKKIKYLVLILVVFIFFGAGINVLAQQGVVDDSEVIKSKLMIILRDVSSGRIDNIENLLSPNASDSFRQEIKRNIQGKSIEYVQDITDAKQPSPNQVRISGKYTGKGNGWSVSGGSIYFIFERINGDWYLLESDFAKKLSPRYVIKFIGIIFLFAIPLLAFWLWMLIDIITKPIKPKFPWIVILLMFNWVGAVIYFFTAHRRYIKSQNGN